MCSPAGKDACKNSSDALRHAVDEVERAKTKSTLCSALDKLKSTVASLELTPSPAFMDELKRIEHAAIDHASIDVRVRAVAACRALWVRALEVGATVNAGNTNSHDIVRRALNVITRRVRIEREEDVIANLSGALSDLTPYILSCKEVCAALEAVGAFARAEDVRAAVDIECVRALSDRAVDLNVTTVTKACEDAYYMLQGYAMRHRRQAMRVVGVMACGALARVEALCCPDSVVHEDYARAMLRASVDAKPDVREACCASIAEHLKSRMEKRLMTFRAADAKLLYAMCVCSAADDKLTWYMDDINRAYAHIFWECTSNVMMHVKDDIINCISDDVLRACETSAAREQCIKAMSVCIRWAGINARTNACIAEFLNNVALVYNGKFFVNSARSSVEEALACQVLRDLSEHGPMYIKHWIEPMTRGLADVECARGYLCACKDLLQIYSELTEKLFSESYESSRRSARKLLRGDCAHLGVIVSSIYDLCCKAVEQASPELEFDLIDSIDAIEACVDVCFKTYVRLSWLRSTPNVLRARFVVLKLLCWAQTEDVLYVPDNLESLNFVKAKFINAELRPFVKVLTDAGHTSCLEILMRMYAALYKRHDESMSSVLRDMVEVGVMDDISWKRAADESALYDALFHAWKSMCMFELYIVKHIAPRVLRDHVPEEAAKELAPSFDALLACLRWRPGVAAKTIRVKAARLFQCLSEHITTSAVFLLWLERRPNGVGEVADLALTILGEDGDCPREIKDGALAFVRAFARIDINTEKLAQIVEACIERLSCSTDEETRPEIASAVCDVISQHEFSRKKMRHLLQKVFPHIDDDNPLVRNHVLKLLTNLKESPHGGDVARMLKDSTIPPCLGCLSKPHTFRHDTWKHVLKKPTDGESTDTS